VIKSKQKPLEGLGIVVGLTKPWHFAANGSETTSTSILPWKTPSGKEDNRDSSHMDITESAEPKTEVSADDLSPEQRTKLEE